MKNFLIVLSVLILLSWLTGLIFLNSLNKVVITINRAAWLAFAFVWIPVFLFYAYDRKQRRKQNEDQPDDDDSA